MKLIRQIQVNLNPKSNLVYLQIIQEKISS